VDRLLFLHLPKTAGMAVDEFLAQHFERNSICPYHYEDQLWSAAREEFERYAYFRGHFFLDSIRAFIAGPCDYITIVRDPIKRFISNFEHWQLYGVDNQLPVSKSYFTRLTLDDFVRDEKLVRYIGMHDLQTRLISSRVDPYTPSGASAPVERHETQPSTANDAIETLANFRYTGIFERMTESIYLLSHIFGLMPLIALPYINVSPPSSSRRSVSRRTMERIQAMNALDIALYDRVKQEFAGAYDAMIESLIAEYGRDSGSELDDKGVEVPRVHGLLERHYDRRFAETHELVHQVQVDFDRAVPGIGWHTVEINPTHGTFRWTGPDPASVLDLPLAKDRDLRVRLHLLGAMSEDIVANTKVRINDRPIEVDTRQCPDGTIVLDGVIPRRALARETSFARMTILVPYTIAPADMNPGSADTRKLGICLHRIDIDGRG